MTANTTDRLEQERQELTALLQPWDQTHLLGHWGKLSPDERRHLAARIRKIDFQRLERLFKGDQQQADWHDLAARAVPPPAIRLKDPQREQAAAAAREQGAAALAAGQVGVVLVAGGQGTRLGFDHPKGMFPIGPVSQATLFQILFEKVLAVSRRYLAQVPLYLMTSPATHDETVQYLESENYFGLPAADVKIFCQGTMPAVDRQTGRVLLAEAGVIAESPDGHGGMLAALVNEGHLADIQQRGIQQLFYLQVDNPLVNICDPEFIGHHLLHQSQISTQVVAKQQPTDRVGNVVSIDGKVQIIEYSDLPDSAAQRRAADGTLELWAGNIAVHILDVAFLQRVLEESCELPFHLAKKKVPCLDDHGQLLEPTAENAIKFEQFIFDLLPAAERSIVVEVDESAAFAPVKNAPGAAKDSPEYVQAQMVALHTRWLKKAGVDVPEGVPVEISPLVALDAEELSVRLKPGLTVTEAKYFC